MSRTLSQLLFVLLSIAGAASAAAETAGLPPPEGAAPVAPSGQTLDPITSDLNKERRWREQIVDSLVDGEAVDLHAGDLTFLGVYTEATGAGGGPGERAAIVIHGIGVHPDWPQVVHPLRVGLPEMGISTLAIQMPVLANEASASDYLPLMDAVSPRLDAAIAFLKDAGARHIAIVAHSLGATMAADYLATHPGAVDAYVAIGLSGASNGESKAGAGRLDNTRTLGRIRIPMLDLYGQLDLEGVVDSAPARARSAVEGGNLGYNQAQVPAADHFFEGQDQALVETVGQWLDQTLPRG